MSVAMLCIHVCVCMCVCVCVCVRVCVCVQPGAVKLALCGQRIRLSCMHPVTSENQFHSTRLYVCMRACVCVWQPMLMRDCCLEGCTFVSIPLLTAQINLLLEPLLQIDCFLCLSVMSFLFQRNLISLSPPPPPPPPVWSYIFILYHPLCFFVFCFFLLQCHSCPQLQVSNWAILASVPPVTSVNACCVRGHAMHVYTIYDVCTTVCAESNFVKELELSNIFEVCAQQWKRNCILIVSHLCARYACHLHSYVQSLNLCEKNYLLLEHDGTPGLPYVWQCGHSPIHHTSPRLPWTSASQGQEIKSPTGCSTWICRQAYSSCWTHLIHPPHQPPALTALFQTQCIGSTCKLSSMESHPTSAHSWASAHRVWKFSSSVALFSWLPFSPKTKTLQEKVLACLHFC